MADLPAMLATIHYLEQAELAEAAALLVETRMFRQKADFFANSTDEDFIKNFRLNKALVRRLVVIVSPFITPPSRSSAVDVETKVLAALHFFATGSCQLPVGCTLHVGISQPSISRAINEVVNALNKPEIFNQWVKFPPNIQALNQIRTKFSRPKVFSLFAFGVLCRVALPPSLANVSATGSALMMDTATLSETLAKEGGSTTRHNTRKTNNENRFIYMYIKYFIGPKFLYFITKSIYSKYYSVQKRTHILLILRLALSIIFVYFWFYNKYRFPGIIGCIDCTHVAIFPPNARDPVTPAHIYVNRKAYHSINVQLICDSDLQILHVNVRFPGSTRDTYIWKSSSVEPVLKQLYRRGQSGYYLLGGSGYPLRPWLMTQIDKAEPGSPEDQFNTRFRSIRSTFERCNSVLKMRFRCLCKDRILHYAPVKASKIINACVVLHNMCVEDKFDLPENLIDHNLDLGLIAGGMAPELEPGAVNNINPDLVAGRAIQNRIVQSYF